MASCTNITHAFCFNGGQCVNDQCLCTSLCYSGRQCEESVNAIDLPFPSAIQQDHPSTRAVYIIIITLLVAIALINNIFALITLFRERIRTTVCGVYLILFASCSFIVMCFFQTTALTVAGYDTTSYRLWSCNIIPYISLTLGYTAIWLSVGISIEKVLIECFNYAIIGSRLRAILLSVGFVLVAAMANLANIFARHYTLDPFGHPICVYNYVSNPQWALFNRISSYTHVIVPITIHLICAGCILTTIARRKVLIQGLDRSTPRLCEVWLQQLHAHRDFFIPPLCMIFFVFPNSIYGNLLNVCVPYSEVSKLRLHIAFVLLLHGPIISTFMIYIYPSDVYTKEFQQTSLYRRLCCWCYQRRRNEQIQRRPRAFSCTTLQSLVVDS